MINDWKPSQLYKCPLCGQDGLLSVWVFIKKDGQQISPCTGCANDLRHKYGDGKNLTIVEKP